MTSEKAYSVEARLNALIAAQPARVWRVTQQGNFTSTSPAAIVWENGEGWDGTSIPVLAGATYLVRGQLIAAMGSPNQNQFCRFSGPTASSVAIGFQCIEGTQIYSSGIQSALGADCTINMVASTSGEFLFQGIIVFTVAGNLSMTGRISATTPWAVQGGSYLEATQIG